MPLRHSLNLRLSPDMQPPTACAAMPLFPQGAWRRQPYDEIEFEEIESFVVAGDCGEERDAAALPTKLLTSLTPEAAAEAAGAAGG